MFFRLLATLCLIGAVPAAAHEFWLSPESYEVAPGEPIKVNLRNGENFKGPAYSYIPRDIARFDVIMPDGSAPVEGTIGDRPALSMAAPEDGLVVVVHETTENRLTYTEWAKFQKFVAHKDFAGALEAHLARGLPQEGFKETYSRHVKALIASGSGAGADRFQGLKTEIVAVTNPYTDDLSTGMVVDVIFDGAARPDAQVELFERAPDGTVEITLHRTDESGRAALPVKPGYDYLADAVVLEDTGENDPAAGPVWRTYWAALTFHVPD